MQTNNHKISDYSAVLDAQYGEKGTAKRAKFDDEAYAFYVSQVLLDARKNVRLTQEDCRFFTPPPYFETKKKIICRYFETFY